MSKINNVVFANNLRYYMEINNKCRKDLVNDLNFKYSTVCEWISGKKTPRMDKIQKLSEYFKVTYSDLLEEHTNKKSAPAEEPGRSKEKEAIQMLRELSDSDLDDVVKYIAFRLAQGKTEK